MLLLLSVRRIHTQDRERENQDNYEKFLRPCYKSTLPMFVNEFLTNFNTHETKGGIERHQHQSWVLSDSKS